MSERTLLITEQVTPSPRLAIAAALAAGQTAEIGSFASGRAPAAALTARLGLPHRALAASHAPNAEASIVGACTAFGASRLIVWNCPRAASALHAIRTSRMSVQVEYVLPAHGSSPWDETMVIAMRAANLIDIFHVEDATTQSRLVDIGVPAHRIAPIALPDRGTAGKSRAHVTVISSRQTGSAALLLASLRQAQVPATLAHPHLLVAAAMGWCARAGTLVVADDAVESWAVLAAAARAGWNPMVTDGANSGHVPTAHWLRALPANPTDATNAIVMGLQ